MRLEEFIKGTLTGIDKGVAGANEGEKNFQLVGAGDDGGVVFDVAVTVSDKGEKSVGGGIAIATLGIGGKGSKLSSEEVVSRIKFKVKKIAKWKGANIQPNRKRSY